LYTVESRFKHTRWKSFTQDVEGRVWILRSHSVTL